MLAPNAAPAHLFGVATGPLNRLVVYSRDSLRAALHNAMATCNLDDVRLCVDRGAFTPSSPSRKDGTPTVTARVPRRRRQLGVARRS